MTDKELRHLSRGELLELLLAQTQENETLKQDLEQAQSRLQERQLALEQAGSIAEASLRLNGVFEAAQQAAQQYLDNIQRMDAEQKDLCAKLRADAERYAADTTRQADAQAAEILRQAEETRRQTLAEAAQQAQAALQEAEEHSRQAHAEADSYWKQVIQRALELLKNQDALRDAVQAYKEADPT